jgi:hypothetical protein
MVPDGILIFDSQIDPFFSRMSYEAYKNDTIAQKCDLKKCKPY